MFVDKQVYHAKQGNFYHKIFGDPVEGNAFVLFINLTVVLSAANQYSQLPITRTFKGNRKRFELSGVRVIGSSSYQELEENSRE